MGCGYIFCLIVGLGGLGLLYVAKAWFDEGRQPAAGIAGGFGVLLCAAAVGLIPLMQREVARARERARREVEHPNAPWTWEPAWRDPAGIPQTGRRNGRALLVFAVLALLISSPVFFAIRGEMERGNQLIWLGLIFPMVSLWILGVAALDAWRRKKYGVARFVPERVPLGWGTRATGMVIVSRPVMPSGPARVELACWRTTITRDGGKRRQREEVVAQVERELAAADWSTAGGESRIFVQVPAQGGNATTMEPATIEHPSYEWRLSVRVPTAGADFVAEFVLPVFANADAGDTGMSSGSEVARGRGSAIDAAEALRAAEIREVDQPGAVGGRALQMPSRPGRAVVWGPLLMALTCGGIALALWFSPVPGVFAVLLALFALLPAMAVPGLWSGGGERVWIERGEICVQRGSTPVTRVPLANVVRIEPSKSVGVGSQQFYRVVARLRPKEERHVPGRVTLAAMVRGAEATTAVVGWIEERVTRKI